MKLYIITGACGSGKSTMKDALTGILDQNKYACIDCDEVGLNWWDYAGTERESKYKDDTLAKAVEMAEDALGLMLVILACIVSAGVTMTSLKLLLIVMFMWCSSPVSGHFLGKIEYRTNPDLARYLRYPEKEGETGSRAEGGDSK